MVYERKWFIFRGKFFPKLKRVLVPVVKADAYFNGKKLPVSSIPHTIPKFPNLVDEVKFNLLIKSLFKNAMTLKQNMDYALYDTVKKRFPDLVGEKLTIVADVNALILRQRYEFRV